VKPVVAIVSRWYPDESEPATGIFVAHQARALATEATVHVLIPRERSWREVAAFLRSRAPISGEAVVPVPRLFALGSLARALVFGRALGRLSPAPTVVHLHELLPDGAPLAWAARRHGIPLVVTEHSNFVGELLVSVRGRASLRRVLRVADAVLTSSSWVAEQLVAFEPRVQPQVVGVPIDTDLFRPDPDATRDFVLAVAVRLGEPKGTDVLLAAWSAAAGLLPLVLVGADDDSWELRAHELGIAHRCRFAGSVPQAEVARLMANAAVVVSASRSETFAGVVAEALACGTPVVATRVGEPELYVSSDDGERVPPGDATALASAVAAVGARHFDPAELRSRIDARYGYDAQRERLLLLYRSLVVS
jgi:glycosyltransferase involved in cell wall biosynthesis